MARQLSNSTSFCEDMGLIPGLAQWVSDPALLLLWGKPVATAQIGPLAWETSYAMGVALKKRQKDKKKNRYEVNIWIC